MEDVKKEKMSCVGPVTAESTRKGVKQKQRAEEEETRKKSKKMKKKADNNVYEASSSSSVQKFSFTIKPSSLVLAVRLTNTQSPICGFGLMIRLAFFFSFHQTIPQPFAKEHMPKETTKFIIHDPKGKTWEVVYFYSDGQKLFSSGWRILARGYGLAVGDVCTLKLIKPKEMALEVLHASQMK